MKQLLSALLIVCISATAFSQSAPIDLPLATLIPHYRLSVSFNTTTVLVFPAAVRPIDRGDRDILAIKQPGVENVLKVKANRRNFSPTNLHVFTADGRIYAFDVDYTDSMASSRDLTVLPPAHEGATPPPVILLTSQVMNDADLNTVIGSLHQLPDHRSLVHVKHERMTLTIDKIGQQGGLLFLRLEIRNRSNLRYQLDFIRCYVRDKEKARRTSIQEQELPITYQDSIPLVAGHTRQSAVIALPIFTLANGKEGIIEAFEKNGGRSLILHLHNKTLLKARPL